MLQSRELQFSVACLSSKPLWLKVLFSFHPSKRASEYEPAENNDLEIVCVYDIETATSVYDRFLEDEKEELLDMLWKIYYQREETND